MKKKKPAFAIKPVYDLACSKCGQINRYDSLFQSTCAFCPRCQEKTQHYPIAIRDVDVKSLLQPVPVLPHKHYSPEGEKRMGFGKRELSKAKS
jgi:hypothetical protein